MGWWTTLYNTQTVGSWKELTREDYIKHPSANVRLNKALPVSELWGWGKRDL